MVPLKVTITNPTPDVGKAKPASMGEKRPLVQVTILPGALNVPSTSEGLSGPKVRSAMPAAMFAGVTWA